MWALAAQEIYGSVFLFGKRKLVDADPEFPVGQYARQFSLWVKFRYLRFEKANLEI
jgi:hypothetical protein